MNLAVSDPVRPPAPQPVPRTSSGRRIAIRAGQLVAALFWLGAAHVAAQSQVSPLAMTDIAELARFRPVERVGMFSSYDRSGGNDDGFTGRYSYLRREGDGLVIAELAGAGALTRIWTATPIDAPIEFYIDGETTPRIAMPFSDIFRGDRPPFTGERVGHALGGYYAFTPIEFAKSIKVIVRAPRLLFYQINYALYAPQAEFTARARAPGARIDSHIDLAPGATATLYETTEPGRILSVRLGPASAFVGPARDIDLRVTWDGAAQPAIEAPVGDLFGFSFGEPAARSALFGESDGWLYLNAPMPFRRGARIELVSRRANGPPVRVLGELVVSPEGRADDEGMLHARWRRENPIATGRPFNLFDARGRGHLVAFAVQAQGLEPGHTGFFEGDDIVTIDGRMAIHGTGSEDMFNGGYYALPGRWDGRGATPARLSGALGYNRQISRTGGYRVLLGDAYSFSRSLRFDLEHGPENNAMPADYTGITLYYLDRAAGAGETAPNAAQRAVTGPSAFRVLFFPILGLDMMINASLAPGGRDVGAGWIATARFARDTDGTPEGLAVDDDTTFDDTFDPPTLVLRVEAAHTGRYAIFAEALSGPDAAMLQLRVNDDPVGAALDFYAPAPTNPGPQLLGEVDLEAGVNRLYLTLPGRNAASNGSGVDLISIEGRLIPPAAE
jgi:hypothetical protein